MADVIDGEVVELDAGASKARVLMTRADAASLQRADLVAAVFNMKGRPHPVPGHFKDWADWEQEGARRLEAMRRHLATLQREQTTLQHVPPVRRLMAEWENEHTPAADTSTDMADAIDKLTRQIEAVEQQLIEDAKPRGRVALVPCEHKRGAADVINVRFMAAEHEFVTHIALGARQPDGSIRVLGGAALTAPIVVLAGSVMRMGIRMTPGLVAAPDERLLPPAAFRKAIEDHGTSEDRNALPDVRE